MQRPIEENYGLEGHRYDPDVEWRSRLLYFRRRPRWTPEHLVL